MAGNVPPWAVRPWHPPRSLGKGLAYIKGMVDLVLDLRVLCLLCVANGAPVVACLLLGRRWNWPLDGGYRFVDGRPWLGSAKTLRGLASGIVLGALCAPVLGFDWLTGAALASLSLLGDIGSSFTKRRLGQPVHAQALGLDQIPEALLPLLVMQRPLTLGAADMALIVAAFVVLDLALPRLLVAVRPRDLPD